MLITYNCEWTSPDEHLPAHANANLGLEGLSAFIGMEWKPICPANDNLPLWLEVYG